MICIYMYMYMYMYEADGLHAVFTEIAACRIPFGAPRAKMTNQKKEEIEYMHI